MKVTWVIERHIFEEEQELALIAEVHKQGGEVKVIDPLSKYNYNDWEDYGWHLENRPVVFRGSLNLGIKTRQQAWYPGVIMSTKNFNCSTYYTYWGEWMLNKDYWMMPLSQLFNNNFIEACLYGIQDINVPEVFIRPDSGLKQFAGGVFNLSDLRSLNGIDLETLVLVAPVKQVDREYRFVVCDNKVITGSQYFEKGEYTASLKDYSKDYGTNKASDYLKVVLHDMSCKINWLPDQIYCVDVCESEGEFNILELNSFSCSNLYYCDLSKVVTAANDVAISEWQQVNV